MTDGWTYKPVVRGNRETGAYSIVDGETLICQMPFAATTGEILRARADQGSLIASAPDLLRQRDELADALEMFVDYAEVYESNPTYSLEPKEKRVLEAARTALANAGRRG